LTNRIYLILAAIFVAFFLYLSSVNKDTFYLGLGGSGWEAPVVLVVFIAFLLGLALPYFISLIKNTLFLFRNIQENKDKKNLEKATFLLRQAKKSFTLGNKTEGELHLREVLSLKCKSTEPYILLLKYYLEDNDLEKVFALLDNMPPAIASDIEVLFYKVKALMAKNSFDRAIDVARDIAVQENTIDLKKLLRDAYMACESWDKAAEVQDEILKLVGKGDKEVEKARSARLDYELARKLIKSGEEDNAIKKFKDLIKRLPEYSQPYVSLGKLYWKKEEKKLAREIWNKGYEKTGNIFFLFLFEDYCLKDGEPQKIIDAYSNTLIKEPDNAILTMFFGKLYLRLEMLDEAVTMLNKAYELNVDSTYNDMMMGEALFRQGSYQEAGEKFKSALGFSRRILIPFKCSSCGKETFEWCCTCTSCGAWDALQVSISERNKKPGQ